MMPYSHIHLNYTEITHIYLYILWMYIYIYTMDMYIYIYYNVKVGLINPPD